MSKMQTLRGGRHRLRVCDAEICTYEGCTRFCVQCIGTQKSQQYKQRFTTKIQSTYADRHGCKRKRERKQNERSSSIPLIRSTAYEFEAMRRNLVTRTRLSANAGMTRPLTGLGRRRSTHSGEVCNTLALSSQPQSLSIGSWTQRLPWYVENCYAWCLVAGRHRTLCCGIAEPPFFFFLFSCHHPNLQLPFSVAPAPTVPREACRLRGK